MKLLGKLPLKVHYFFADLLCFILKDLVRYRREVVTANLSRSFPSMSYRELHLTIKDFYRHLAEIFAETIWFAGSGGNFDRINSNDMFTVTEMAGLNEALRNEKGVLVVMSHCGNWELTANIFNEKIFVEAGGHAFRPDDTYIVYKRVASKTWDQIFYENRISSLPDYAGQTESMDVLRVMLRNKGRQCVYVFPSDQAPYKQATGYPVGKFLNQETDAMLGGFAAAHKMGFSVAFMDFARAGRGRYRLGFELLTQDAALEDPIDTMKKYYDALERSIISDPANWLWTHKRWKTSRHHKDNRDE
ncbi:MAG: hypothetical protein HUJ94_00815 [Bacteroidales bacterium]|nr:hypothetical protein [Bacteroidales bacterium]